MGLLASDVRKCGVGVARGARAWRGAGARGGRGAPAGRGGGYLGRSGADALGAGLHGKGGDAFSATHAG